MPVAAVEALGGEGIDSCLSPSATARGELKPGSLERPPSGDRYERVHQG